MSRHTGRHAIVANRGDIGHGRRGDVGTHRFGIGGGRNVAEDGIERIGGVARDRRRRRARGVHRLTSARARLSVSAHVTIGIGFVTNRLETITHSATSVSASAAIGVLASLSGEPVNVAVFPRRPGSERHSGPSWTMGRGKRSGVFLIALRYDECWMQSASLTARTGWCSALAGSMKVTCPCGYLVLNISTKW